jgi:adenosylhomocysteine nucleosidase
MGAGCLSERDAPRNDSLSRVGIVAALTAEARAVCPRIKRHSEPIRLEDGTLLAVSGIGDIAASRAAFRLIEAGAQALVSFGLAGGLDPALRAGAIFLPTEVMDAQDQVLPTSNGWRERVGQALIASAPIVLGTLLSSPKAIIGVRDKAHTFQTTGARAVDMESMALARAAASRGLPFLAVRVIVDTAQDALPPELIAATDSGHVRVWHLISWLALAPTNIVGLIRLARRYQVASRSLHAAAAIPSLRDAVIG